MIHTEMQWRDLDPSIVGLDFEAGRYRISEFGDVLDLRPKIMRSEPIMGGRLISQTPDGSRGYRLVRLAGLKTQQRVHRLVALAFGTAVPDDECVRHLDDNKANNHYSNLRGGTESDNRRDCIRNSGYLSQNAEKTHCKRGHEFTEANTRTYRSGGSMKRGCVACNRDYQRAYYHIRRAKSLGGV